MYFLEYTKFSFQIVYINLKLKKFSFMPNPNLPPQNPKLPDSIKKINQAANSVFNSFIQDF